MDWLKDVLGINRYVVAWRFECPPAYWHEGSTRKYGRIGGVAKRSAAALASRMSSTYGAGTHWIEKVEAA